MTMRRIPDRDEQQLLCVRDAQMAHADRTAAKIFPPDDPPPHYRGHRERLRNRFREAGANALADYELLEMLLFRSIPLKDTKPIAKALIAKFGSFAEVLAAPRQRLEEIKGGQEEARNRPQPLP